MDLELPLVWGAACFLQRESPPCAGTSWQKEHLSLLLSTKFLVLVHIITLRGECLQHTEVKDVLSET